MKKLALAGAIFTIEACSSSEPPETQDACLIYADSQLVLCQVQTEVEFGDDHCLKLQNEVQEIYQGLSLMGLATEPDTLTHETAPECPLEQTLSCHNQEVTTLLYDSAFVGLDSTKQTETCEFWQ